MAQGEDGERVDRVVARRLGIPRSHAQSLLNQEAVRVGGTTPTPARRMREGEEIEVTWTGPGITPTPSSIPILYEDDALVVVDKPRGLAVHPVGHREEMTVVSVLLARGPLASGAPGRPGVVHRLDTATTGALVLAKTSSALQALIDQFRHREVVKEYLGVVDGVVEEGGGVIEGRVGRDAGRPWRMRIGGVKDAHTEFSVLARGQAQSLLLVRPRTGRTHQIRVHLTAIGHPVSGDPLYGHGEGPLLLHAWRLGFRHPSSGAWVQCEAVPPPEFAPLLAARGSTPPR